MPNTINQNFSTATNYFSKIDVADPRAQVLSIIRLSMSIIGVIAFAMFVYGLIHLIIFTIRHPERKDLRKIFIKFGISLVVFAICIFSVFIVPAGAGVIVLIGVFIFIIAMRDLFRLGLHEKENKNFRRAVFVAQIGFILTFMVLSAFLITSFNYD